MDNSQDFIIRNKPAYLIIFTLIIVLSVLCALALIILSASGFISGNTGWYFLSIPAFFCLISLFGIYTCIKEAFSLKDGVFTYVKAIKKTQSVKAEDISSVSFRYQGFYYKIEFKDKNGNIPLAFLDEGTVLQGNYLINALNHFKIPYKFF